MGKKKKSPPTSLKYIAKRPVIETRNFGGNWHGSLELFLKKVDFDVKALRAQGATVIDIELDSEYVDDDPDSKPAITLSVSGYRRETAGEARARESRRKLYEELRKEFEPIRTFVEGLVNK